MGGTKNKDDEKERKDVKCTKKREKRRQENVTVNRKKQDI